MIKSKNETAPAPVSPDLLPVETPRAVSTNWQDQEVKKSRRILVQGITQAAMQSPGLTVLRFATVEELSKLTETFSANMVRFVDEQTK